MNADLWNVSKKSGVLYAFRKRNFFTFLTKLNCVSINPKVIWPYVSQIYGKPSTNTYWNLSTCSSLQYMARLGAHREQCEHHRGVNHTVWVGWQVANPLCHLLLLPQILTLLPVSLFAMLSVSEWPCWYGGQEKDQLWFKEVPRPCWVVSF